MLENDYKKERILKIAKQYFYQQGFNTVSMDDIAKKSSMSKKTIYTFFESKAWLIHEILENEIQQLESKIKDIQELAPNAVAELFLFFEFLNVTYSKITRSFMNDLKKSPLQISVDAYYDRVQHFLLVNFERGQTEGLYKSIIEIEAVIATFRRFVHLLFSEGNHTAITVCNDIVMVVKMYSLYLVTTDGHQYINKKERL